MSALPKQVAAQLKEVEELEAQMLDAGNPPAEAPVESEPVPPENPPTSTEQPTPEPTVQPVAKTEDWEAKYRSLQGMFNSQMPKLQSENKELRSHLETMQRQIEELKQPKTTQAEDRLVSDKDEEQFGADLIDVARRIAKDELRTAATQYRKDLADRDAKIANLEAMLGRTGGAVATMSFEQQLERAIPDFHELNRNPQWIAWLDGVDPYTSEPRRMFAENVYNAGDVDKLSQIVAYYKASTQPQQQDQQRQQRQTELQKQVAPSRTATASVAPQGDRYYTEAEASRLWDKVKVLYVNGQNDEGRRIENELSLAEAQGRIRG
jgi:hypothetical protein